VAFRACMRDVALEHEVRGWVRNRDDGVVVSILQGEEEQVERVVEWARRGPPAAKVTGFRKERLDRYPQQSGFRILD
jgi:acylphosphatase